MRQKNDNQFGWKDQEEMMMSLCPDVLNCRSCNKLASQSDLDDNGNCWYDFRPILYVLFIVNVKLARSRQRQSNLKILNLFVSLIC
jgi:hypothetical protein